MATQKGKNVSYIKNYVYKIFNNSVVFLLYFIIISRKFEILDEVLQGFSKLWSKKNETLTVKISFKASIQKVKGFFNI